MGVIIAEALPILISLIQQTPAAVKAAQEIWDLLTRDTAPTPEEKAAWDAAAAEAHRAAQEL